MPAKPHPAAPADPDDPLVQPTCDLDEITRAIDEINATDFIVSLKAQTVVAHLDDEGELSFWPFQEFRRRLIKRIVMVSDGDGNNRVEQLADVWLKAPRGRQYRRLAFTPPPQTADPRDYNLWAGFAVEATPGDWSLLRNHIHRIVCGADDERFTFLLDKLAALVQRPGERKGDSGSTGASEIAVVLRGQEGCGKSIVVREVMSLFPRRHVMHLSSARGLVGQFNAHLLGRLVVFADESFFAGDRKNVGALKALITEPTIAIEPKRVDMFEADNYAHIFVSSNEEWVIPAGLEARRFLMLDVGSDRVGHHDYFAAITKQQAAGGHAAMLYDLQRRRLTVNLRDVPKTEALLDQKLLTMSAAERWWFEILQAGRLLARHDDRWDADAETEVLRDELCASYRESVKGRRRRDDDDDRASATELGLLLRRLLPSGYPLSRQRAQSSREIPITERFIAGASAAGRVSGSSRRWSSAAATSRDSCSNPSSGTPTRSRPSGRV